MEKYFLDWKTGWCYLSFCEVLKTFDLWLLDLSWVAAGSLPRNELRKGRVLVQLGRECELAVIDISNKCPSQALWANIMGIGQAPDWAGKLVNVTEPDKVEISNKRNKVGQ